MIGTELAHFRLTAKLGEGGMGAVYRAEDSKLGREVALKVLPPETATDPERLERFKREAQSIAALSHPNIVTIHSVEEVQGVHLLTMELVEGRSLDEVLPPEGLDLDRLFPLAIQIADALAAAHDGGVTHRDLKPANVMVTDDDRVKILDFGLAKLATEGEPVGDERTELMTRDGMIVGTVPYMSPEQVEGKPVDHRSDIFSLGVLLYEMATGQRPFRGSSPASVISAVLRDRPPPVTEVRAGLPNHLGRIVQRCLEKDRERRYQSAKEVRNELRALRDEVWLDSAAAARRRATTGAGSGSPAGGSRRVLRWASLAAGVALVAALTLAFWPRSETVSAPSDSVGPVEASIAVLPFDSVDADDEGLAFSSGIHNDLLIRLSKIGTLKVISRTSVMEYRDTTKNVREIAGELGVATVLEGSVQRAGERVRLSARLVNARTDESIWAEAYDRELTAASIFDIQEEIAEQIAAALRARLTAEDRRELATRPTENLEAYAAYLRGLEHAERSEEEADNRIAVAALEQAVELDPGFAQAHAVLGQKHAEMYWMYYDHTPERLERARMAIETAEHLAPELAETRMARGFYRYWALLDYDGALESLRLAAEAQPNNSTIVSGIGFVLRRQGRMDEALEQFRRAAELDPRDLVSLEAVAATLLLVREYEEAQRWYARLQLRNPAASNTWANQGLIALLARGDREGACEIFREGSSRIPLEPGLDLTQHIVHPAVGGCDDEVRRRLDRIEGEVLVDNQDSFLPRALAAGLVPALRGEGETARASFEAARVLLERRAREHPDDHRVPSSLGLAYAGLGRAQEAIRQGLRGVEMLGYERDAVRGAQRVSDLAAIYSMVGDAEAAVDRLEFLLARPSYLSIPYLEIDPTWDPIRMHPRFQALLER